MVNTELTKAKRFEMGLRPEIKGIMAAQLYTTYAQTLRRAQAISNGLGLEKKPMHGVESSEKRKWQGHNKEKECPEKKKEDYQPKKGKTRVFTLAGQEGEQDTDVITGILPISNIPAIVLIDSGAMHSFISTVFMDKIGNKYEKTNGVLDVSIPSGEIISTNQIVKDIKLEIEGRILKEDLYLLGMKDFDVILEMDWLSGNHATIFCRKKEVLFQRPGEEQFRFFGIKFGTPPKFLSSLKAEKMLRKDRAMVFY
ncbi:Pepsin-retropepsin like protein [Abeliophyllum distichum]|uniref:Pepsin-retropepsin like protein n=1 Tax=Abeliophyllum distichum TaxID=126358 RepID=A0ABD1VWD0_9LAMI